MGKLPPEDQLDPDLEQYDYPGDFGEFCDSEAEDVPTPELDDMDQDAPELDDEPEEIEDDELPEGEESNGDDDADLGALAEDEGAE